MEFSIHIGVFMKLTRSLFLTQNKGTHYVVVRVHGVTNGDKCCYKRNTFSKKSLNNDLERDGIGECVWL